jgi:transposase
LVSRLFDVRDGLVVLEATGKYEAVAAASLASSGFKVAVVNPRQMRNFAHSTGRLAKTDRLDAEAIALFAEGVKPKVRALANEQEAQFAELLARRRQLIEMLVAENNRLKGVASRKVGRSIKVHITWLKQALGRVDDDLSDAVESSPCVAIERGPSSQRSGRWQGDVDNVACGTS